MSKKWVDVSKLGEVASRGKGYTDSLVSSLSTITQTAIAELDETKQDNISGQQGTVVTFDNAGTLSKIAMWSNENLLRNADFRYPENQNGMEVYTVDSTTEAIPCLNHWWLIGHGQLVIEDGYIRLIPSEDGDYVTMYQDVPLTKVRHIIGNPVTVSIFGTGPMVAYFSGYNPSTDSELNLGWASLIVPANASLTGDSKCYSRTHNGFEALPEEGMLRAKFSAMTANGEARYSVVKLERGNVQTLAFKTGSNTWSLNTIMPSYSESGEDYIPTGDPGSLAVYNTDGKLSSFSGSPGDLVGIDEDGKAVNVSKSSIVSSSIRVNKNLIPNWNFQNALNSGWKSMYPDGNSNFKTCIDGWMIPEGSMQLVDINKVSYVLSSKTNPDLAQTVLTTGALWNGRNGGGPLTLSFLVGNVLNGSVRASVAFENGSKYSTDVADSSEYGSSKTLLTVTIENPGKAATVIIEHMGGTSLRFTPYAIKLEEGEESTLAYQNAESEWMLFEHAVDQIQAWAEANKRTPIGKNMLANADFKHFVNPDRVATAYYLHSLPGWNIPSTATNVYFAGLNMSSLGQLTMNPSSSTDVLIEQEVSPALYPYQFLTMTVQGVNGSPSANLPIVKIQLKGASNTWYDFCQVDNYVDFISSVTFQLPSDFVAMKVQVCTQRDSRSSYITWIAKIKLESGMVETLTREMGWNYGTYVDQSLENLANRDALAIKYATEIVNPDLLINSDFTRFINESGKNEWELIGSANGTFWNNSTWSASVFGNTNVTLMAEKNSFKISGNLSSSSIYFFQRHRLDMLKIGDNNVLSIVYKTESSDGVLYCHTDLNFGKTITLPSTGGAWKIASLRFSKNHLGDSTILDVGISANASISIEVAQLKLEVGRYQTLARYDSDGNVIILPRHRDEALELERVHRREIWLPGDGSVIGIARSYRDLSFIGIITLPTIMNWNPSFLNPSCIRFHDNYTGTTLLSQRLNGNNLVVHVGSTNAPQDVVGFLYIYTESFEKVRLNANP